METNPRHSENAKRDAEFVVAASSGDEQAFARLMAFYKEALHFMLYRMVKSNEVAEDLTIEAFGKALANIQNYEPQYAFSTWLFCIASNLAIDHLRSRRICTVKLEAPIQTFKNPGVNYKVITKADNQEQIYIKEQNARLLLKSVDSLKPRFRTLLEMWYLMNYSYAEIADELNLPLGAIKVQMFRSRELIYDLLKNKEIRNYSNLLILMYFIR